MIERGYARNFADWTFAQLDGFGSDGFSESHAASFALIASGIGFLAHICLLTAKLHANDIATVIQIQTLNQTTADRYPTIVIAVMLTGFCHKIAAQAELLV